MTLRSATCPHPRPLGFGGVTWCADCGAVRCKAWLEWVEPVGFKLAAFKIERITGFRFAPPPGAIDAVGEAIDVESEDVLDVVPPLRLRDDFSKGVGKP